MKHLITFIFIISISFAYCQKNKPVYSTVNDKCEMWAAPDIRSKVIRYVPKDSNIRIITFVKSHPTDYFYINYKNDTGYIKCTWALENKEVLMLRKRVQDSIYRVQDSIYRMQMKPYIRKWTKLYGATECKKILYKIKDGKVWIGMTTEMARLSWGEPDDINTTINKYTRSEQWIYGSSYLYFDNGILTTIQN